MYPAIHPWAKICGYLALATMVLWVVSFGREYPVVTDPKPLTHLDVYRGKIYLFTGKQPFFDGTWVLADTDSHLIKSRHMVGDYGYYKLQQLPHISVTSINLPGYRYCEAADLSRTNVEISAYLSLWYFIIPLGALSVYYRWQSFKFQRAAAAMREL